ncbi:flagellar basal body-associated protein FliL [Thaumasiovibrio subtropicus]|uniref:flagellar basal body-associated protein FliL n=1 Tax=Thaumasiovibrio subtropicus TaxID=1891207 RepID=UPI000B3599C2|nr:flagellar basal body-associated protein FliL [Thaumasiovibrio subtropicus]
MRFRSLNRLFCVVLTLLSLAFPLHAEEEGEVEPQYTYYTLSPDITTNYTTQGKKLGYLRLQIDLMVIDPSLIDILEHHDPLIRDTIIEIVGQEGETTIKTLAGREEIRLNCLDRINQLLLAETGQKVVTELLFTKYLYQ